MIDPTVGDRIVVRYRLDHAAAPADWRAESNPALSGGPSQSDVTGVLKTSDEKSLLIDRDGVEVAIPRTAITSIRLLSREVVRNSEIRDVERALCDAADATEREEIDGWIVLSGGSTLRGRSAIPVEFNAPSAAVDEICAWYDDLDEVPMALLPDRLTRPGRVPITDVRDLEVLVADRPIDVAGLAPARVDDGLWAVDVDADDSALRAAARDAGYRLHHTAQVGEL
ncbi:GNAT family N-acetyltransferase, cg3035/Rv0428c family [Gordonia humi]|uniref:Histone acetyltransferase Rv0428c-like C-terminal domain-containing protein n=1 Tax=Gordonia humi TaxID=686429 RepID=A0A840F5V3_9ACTN|nr:GCN5 family acetyltransferase [Gordonia humi]MBB4137933.1 hypothetical protein [Gordonia humi]